MHKSATKCNEIVGKWCINKHGASKIIDTLETYHTSAAGSVAKVGADEVAPALGGGIDALVTGDKEASMEVEEATEGEMIDMIPGAYFFAFSKKSSSSE
jgi:hypothetical protein